MHVCIVDFDCMLCRAFMLIACYVAHVGGFYSRCRVHWTGRVMAAAGAHAAAAAPLTCLVCLAAPSGAPQTPATHNEPPLFGEKWETVQVLVRTDGSDI